MKQDKKKLAAAASGTGGRGTTTPCAACKLLRRRCSMDECTFAPYFPASDPVKFATVHKVFGASNVNKMLQDLPVQHRGDAVSSLVYEANARVRDPVYGCVGAISALQQQVHVLQAQLARAQAEVLNMRFLQVPYKTETNSITIPSGKSFEDDQCTTLLAPSPPTSSSSKLTSSYSAKSFLATDRSWW